MAQSELFVVVLISLLLVVLPAPGLYGMFKKAGVPGWKAFVPFYNTWVMQEISGRPKHWVFWQIIPIVGWFITLGIFIEFVKPFGKFKFWQHTAATLGAPLYMPYLGFNKTDKFLGTDIVKKHKKSVAREWIDAGVFAIVAATLIRTFVFEAYTIPTGSMEKTLLVNDFLFVSKFSYGPRIPNTPLAIPFVHHTLPLLKSKSYSELIHIPYTRWFSHPVKRNDVVVFNFPAGDTLTKEYDSEIPYYDIVEAKKQNYLAQLKGQIADPKILNEVAEQKARAEVWASPDFTIMTRPVDKRENYIKRCVGIPGDTIQIKDSYLFINGQPAFVSPTAAIDYIVPATREISVEELEENGISLKMTDKEQDFSSISGYTYRINLSIEELEKIKKVQGVKASEIRRDIQTGYEMMMFPRDSSVAQWTVDNFGPLWIPKKGVEIPLTARNIAFYKRAIRVYENNTWEEKDGKIFINGKEAKSYTFKMDYYWMMGDNRHRSQDSRYWGFVPEDHIVGEAGMIWLSYGKGIRWKRLFSIIH